MLVTGIDLGDVLTELSTGHGDCDGQGGSGTVGQSSNRPHAACVGALGGAVRDIAHTAGQDIFHFHTGGISGPVVGQLDGEGDIVAHIGRGIAYFLEQREVGHRIGGCRRKVFIILGLVAVIVVGC